MYGKAKDNVSGEPLDESKGEPVTEKPGRNAMVESGNGYTQSTKNRQIEPEANLGRSHETVKTSLNTQLSNIQTGEFDVGCNTSRSENEVTGFGDDANDDVPTFAEFDKATFNVVTSVGIKHTIYLAEGMRDANDNAIETAVTGS